MQINSFRLYDSGRFPHCSAILSSLSSFSFWHKENYYLKVAHISANVSSLFPSKNVKRLHDINNWCSKLRFVALSVVVSRGVLIILWATKLTCKQKHSEITFHLRYFSGAETQYLLLAPCNYRACAHVQFNPRRKRLLVRGNDWGTGLTKTGLSFIYSSLIPLLTLEPYCKHDKPSE